MKNMKKRMTRICNPIVLGILLIFNKSCTGILNDPNVCETSLRDRVIYFCCFNYYLIDGKCNECKPGTTSTDGLVCLPCSQNYYGHKCKYTCSCESHRRCNAEFGCVDPPTPSSYIRMTNASQSQNDHMFTTVTEETSDSSTQIQTNILYLMLAAAGLITWLMIFWTCIRLFYHKIRPDRAATQIASEPHLTQSEPICQERQNTNNCVETSSDTIQTFQGRRSTSHMPIKSQHVYDCVNDIAVDSFPPNHSLGSDGCQGTSVVTTNGSYDAFHNCNMIREEPYLNQYHLMKNKQDSSINVISDYVEMNNPHMITNMNLQ